ncbi:Protein CBG25365 [Caenorhabditis briggsae]|uniref:Protein CBG25365 n=1 Tax=Caenorhabditis briggsae TaxID=6238 RepID=B6IIM9_CAEBR|nr:Protein CBG25365 [Caenorhabditis briggsae]CAR99759.1 Protein CBG25365 [Caenorhabditis briggsae]
MWQNRRRLDHQKGRCFVKREKRERVRERKERKKAHFLSTKCVSGNWRKL